MSAETRRALLEITALESWFSTSASLVRAVNKVSLRVAERQALGIVGESGSGKTQTFFSAFGLTSGAPGVVSGRVRFGQTELLESLETHVRFTDDGAVEKQGARWDAVHRKILEPLLGRDVAIMSQDPRRSLVPYWTVGRHLTIVMNRRAATPVTRSDAAALLSTFGFRQPERVLDAFPEQLSGGEAQRAMLAMTTAMSPRLLIADEPTTALDAINQIRVLDALRRLHATSDLAVVLISHDLAVVAGMVDDFLVFFGGRILERAPAALLGASSDAIVHPYTRELLESQRRRARGLPIVGAAQPDRRGAPPVHGCPYAVRCALRPTLDLALQLQCETEFPPEVVVGERHSIACWGVTS